ncbi:MAG: outer membrane protein assembly factor BamA [Candidatus Thioglobus sp.]|nr:outer membrane protein assembly factor BamA [Candidatus Thioglobus sp.]
MCKNIIKISLILGLFFSALANAAIIKSIEISGLNAISRGTVLSYLPVEVGDEYNQQISAKIIQTLYKTQFFKDIEVVQNKQILKITLQENPHIKYIELLNYSDKVLDEERIDEILQSMDLVQGKIFNKKNLDTIVNQLQSAYIAKGYYSAKITKKIEIDNKNRVGIELDIFEGSVAKIDSMKISGNTIYDEDELLDLFDIGEADFFLLNYYTNKDSYSKIALDGGIEAMRSLYVNSGYLDFKASKINTELSDNKEKINIAIEVSEGQQYSVGKIEFSGNTLNQSVAELADIFAVKTGDIFKRKQVVKGIRAITNLFTDQGYAFAKIDPITTENAKTHIIDLNVRILLNQKVYINRITIDGNTRTQDQVVRREINIAEGGLYSSGELNESVKRIRRLGFFSNVKMSIANVKGAKDKVNVNFVVEETKTGQFSVGLSQSNEVGVSFNLGIQESNFLGTGNVLNANLVNSKAVQEISFFFSDPYFTKDKHSISYGVFSKSIDGVELASNSYQIDETGASIGYGIPVSKDTRINTGVSLSTRDITCGGDFENNNEFEQCTSGNKTEVKLSAGWSNNTLNNFRFPTDGQKNSLNAEVTLPIADFKYYKVNATHKSYHPLSKQLTFTAKGDVGFGSGYGGQELPFFERYYGGGASSLRGFDFNSLGKTYTDGAAIGGNLSLLASTSVISTLDVFGKKAENMRVSAFIDAGSISKSVYDFDDIRSAAGVAFSWLTPVGPIGIYAAVPLLKSDGDETKNFDFSLGTSF